MLEKHLFFLENHVLFSEHASFAARQKHFVYYCLGNIPVGMRNQILAQAGVHFAHTLLIILDVTPRIAKKTPVHRPEFLCHY